MKEALHKLYFLVKERAFLATWISLVLYVFYDTFMHYKQAPEFYHLRNILGLGLYVSRGTATVLNISGALVLLPLCKKVNRILYRLLSQLWPELFFFWLEKAKSFHMTVAATLVLFAVIHSISHFANLWNFSRNYDEQFKEINFASYKNENPVSLLLTQPGLTGVSMLLITTLMGMTSLRTVRRRCYNAFWYTHHLYFPFMVLLLIHPLSGVLKGEVLRSDVDDLSSSQMSQDSTNSTVQPRFVAIKSKTWLWMAFPLSCFFIDLLWRMLSRNRARVEILNVVHMPGRTISLGLTCPNQKFNCRMGQYVLLQCLDISLIEWHPFTVVKLPTNEHRNFTIWIRVKGDWTEALEKLLLERAPKSLTVLVDGPFSSPMEGARRSNVAICVAAGVGITPFVSLMQSMLDCPRSHLPGRIHLIWIVRQEYELSWLAELANKTLLELRDANRPDRLNLELYVTNSSDKLKHNRGGIDALVGHIVVINNVRGLTNSVITREKKDLTEDEKVSLLTPKAVRNPVKCNIRDNNIYLDINYELAKEYPLLGCRVRSGRPHWDRIFGYWSRLYPDENLHLYCCGPKKLVKILRNHTKYVTQTTSTTINFVHEGFS